MLHFLIIGTLLGLSAGFSPGPLLTLVITETIRHDIRSGIKVAMVPLLTDIPIIAITFLVLSKLANFNNILGLVSIFGGCFVFFLGYQSIKSKAIELNVNTARPKSLSKGIWTNLLSPHPYLFWLGVGAPIINQAMDISLLATFAFIFSFYLFLVGSKVLLALMVGKSKRFLAGNTYLYTMRILGFLLCILAFVLFYDGLKLMQVV